MFALCACSFDPPGAGPGEQLVLHIHLLSALSIVQLQRCRKFVQGSRFQGHIRRAAACFQLAGFPYLLGITRVLPHQLPFPVPITTCVFIRVVIQAQTVNKLLSEYVLSLPNTRNCSAARKQLLIYSLTASEHRVPCTTMERWGEAWLILRRDGRWRRMPGWPSTQQQVVRSFPPPGRRARDAVFILPPQNPDRGRLTLRTQPHTPGRDPAALQREEAA